MKRRFMLAFSLLILSLGATRQVFAWDGAFFDLFQVPFSAREAALGGNHAAQADDISTLVSNAAGFRSVPPNLSIGATDISIYDGPTNTDGSRDTTYDLFGPLSIAYVGNGLGFGFFSDTNVLSRTRGQYPNGSTQGTENIVLIGGYAFRINLPEASKSTLDVGFSLPLFFAARTNSRQDVRGLFASAITLHDFVINETYTVATGVSAEIGLLYTWDNTLSVGLAARNLAVTSWQTYTSFADYQQGATPELTTTWLPMDISLGIRWNPPIKYTVRAVDGFSLMADYNDIFDFVIYPPGARNPLLHIGLGMEITLLRVVKLRAGFYQLLPSGGLSLDLGFFTLDMAVFGRELSTQPWTIPVYGYMAGIRFHT